MKGSFHTTRPTWRPWVRSPSVQYRWVPYSDAEGEPCSALSSTKSPISWKSASSPAVKMPIASGHLTSAAPPAVLKETPRMGLTAPRSIVTMTGFFSCQPTVDSWVQNQPSV